MKLCDKNYNFSFILEGSCRDCSRRCEKKEVYSMDDIVPSGLCPFAYFSIIPYWVSLMQGARFRWRKTKNDVVCQCPRPKGVVFLVKKVEMNGRISMEVAVVNMGGFICPYKYFVGKIFKIREEQFCPALFPSLWLHWDELNNPFTKELSVECCIWPVSLKVIKR